MLLGFYSQFVIYSVFRVVQITWFSQVFRYNIEENWKNVFFDVFRKRDVWEVIVKNEFWKTGWQTQFHISFHFLRKWEKKQDLKSIPKATSNSKNFPTALSRRWPPMVATLDLSLQPNFIFYISWPLSLASSRFSLPLSPLLYGPKMR